MTMKTGQDLVNFLKTLVGCKYVLGAVVKKDVAGSVGPFDCAEFISYGIYQVYGKLLGCDTDELDKAYKADAYTGYFARDSGSSSKFIVITPEEAAQIPGAILLRKPAPGAIGHIVCSMGHADSVEANCTKYGCIETSLHNRRFDVGLLVVGVEYNRNVSVTVAPVTDTVYRLKTPYMKDEFIGRLQSALGLKGKEIDNTYGPQTQNMVIAFQRAQGLVVDGEVTQTGQTAKALFKPNVH